MLLVGLFRFIGFVSGILLAVVGMAFFLRSRGRHEEALAGAERERKAVLASENLQLKKQIARMEAELEEQRAEQAAIRRRLESLQDGGKKS